MIATMAEKRSPDLKFGFTTGACATAATAAACRALLTGKWTDPVRIVLPRGQTPRFPLEFKALGSSRAEAAVRKDAGDDPDVTHGCIVASTVRPLPSGSGIVFLAGEGVGTVSMPGLPIEPGQPAINPVPRQMMAAAIRDIARSCGEPEDFSVEISIPGGRELALQTWNPRLGIVGGLSILGTTGIVRPFSCSAWIASIHRGIDVARAAAATHVAAATGSTSESVAQNFYGLPDFAMLDMGDFAGGMLKYLRRHPIPMLTISGGFGKLAKLAQGAADLHSSRSRIDFALLAERAATAGSGESVSKAVAQANSAMQALAIAGPGLAEEVAKAARAEAEALLSGAEVAVEIMVVDRFGNIAARSSRIRFPK